MPLLFSAIYSPRDNQNDLLKWKHFSSYLTQRPHWLTRPVYHHFHLLPLPFADSPSDTLASLLLCEHAKHPPTSGSLHLLFPLLPHITACELHLLQVLLKYCQNSHTLPNHSMENSTSPRTLSSYPMFSLCHLPSYVITAFFKLLSIFQNINSLWVLLSFNFHCTSSAQNRAEKRSSH